MIELHQRGIGVNARVLVRWETVLFIRPLPDGCALHFSGHDVLVVRESEEMIVSMVRKKNISPFRVATA